MSEEDVFDKMIKGASWDELKPYRKSKATFYKALDRYFFESELKFKEQQTKISEAEDKKRVAENASDEATKKLDELRGLIDAWSDRLVDITIEVAQKTDQVKNAQKILTEIEEKGISEKVVQKFIGLDFGSEDELLERIATVEEHNRYKKEVADLKSEKKQLKKETEVLHNGINDLKRDFNNWNQKLDDTKKKHLIYEAHIAVAKPFYDSGYTADDVEAFLEALMKVAGKDPAPIYLMPLVDAVKKVAAIKSLDDTIKAKQSLLKLTETKIVTTQGKLDSMQGSLLLTLQQFRKEAEEELRANKEKYVKEINALNNHGKIGLQKIVKDNEEQSNLLFNNLIQSLARINSEGRNAIDTSVNATEQAVNDLRMANQNALDTMNNLGKYESHVKYAHTLTSVLDANIKELDSVPIDILSLLSHRITLYLSRNYNVKTKPSAAVVRLEDSLHDFQDYSVVACSQHVTDYLISLVSQTKPSSPP